MRISETMIPILMLFAILSSFADAAPRSGQLPNILLVMVDVTLTVLRTSEDAKVGMLSNVVGKVERNITHGECILISAS
jgi:hypothetical protein